MYCVFVYFISIKPVRHKAYVSSMGWIVALELSKVHILSPLSYVKYIIYIKCISWYPSLSERFSETVVSNLIKVFPPAVQVYESFANSLLYLCFGWDIEKILPVWRSYNRFSKERQRGWQTSKRFSRCVLRKHLRNL